MDRNLLEFVKLKKQVMKLSAVAFMGALSMFGASCVVRAMKPNPTDVCQESAETGSAATGSQQQPTRRERQEEQTDESETKNRQSRVDENIADVNPIAETEKQEMTDGNNMNMVAKSVSTDPTSSAEKIDYYEGGKILFKNCNMLKQ